MKRIMAMCAAAALTATLVGSIEACTATTTVDKAKNSKDTDQYQAARDVSEEMIDTEGWEKDVYTVDAATGTLLIEKDNGFTVPNNGTTADDWRSVLDNESVVKHGITASGTATITASLKEHMRMHVKEWSDYARGIADPALAEYLDAMLGKPPAPSPTPTSGPVSAPAPATGPWSVPGPVYAPAPAPAPVAAPVPAVDHAG